MKKSIMRKRKKAIKSLTDYKESNLPVSAAAEYLTFVAGSGERSIEVCYQDENIWLTQKNDGRTIWNGSFCSYKTLKKMFFR